MVCVSALRSALEAVQACEIQRAGQGVAEELAALSAREVRAYLLSLAFCVTGVLEITLHTQVVVGGTVLIAKAVHRQAHICRD